MLYEKKVSQVLVALLLGILFAFKLHEKGWGLLSQQFAMDEIVHFVIMAKKP